MRFLLRTLPEQWVDRLLNLLVWWYRLRYGEVDLPLPQCPGCGCQEHNEDDGAHWCSVCRTFFYWDPQNGYRWVSYFGAANQRGWSAVDRRIDCEAWSV